MWAGQVWVAYIQYMPFAVAGGLLPHLCMHSAGPQWALAGFSAAAGTLAVALTSAGLGSGYLLAVWALSAQLACLLLPLVRPANLPGCCIETRLAG